ncbi:MAG: ribonuclease P protein component [Anaerolineales bacterium]|nr:MAG: ribonuclease P protein component [Anaerolineales bacterium]
MAWVKRNFRLTRSTDFKRVRRFGKSYAHPFIVLVALPAEGERTLIGVSAGRSVGSAVDRNRAKRLIREAIRPFLPALQPGWNILLLARKPILQAQFTEIQSSLQTLLTRGQILNGNNERPATA